MPAAHLPFEPSCVEPDPMLSVHWADKSLVPVHVDAPMTRLDAKITQELIGPMYYDYEVSRPSLPLSRSGAIGFEACSHSRAPVTLTRRSRLPISPAGPLVLVGRVRDPPPCDADRGHRHHDDCHPRPQLRGSFRLLHRLAFPRTALLRYVRTTRMHMCSNTSVRALAVQTTIMQAARGCTCYDCCGRTAEAA